MFKLVCLAFVTAATAQLGGHDLGHNHGHKPGHGLAYSSQQIQSYPTKVGHEHYVLERHGHNQKLKNNHGLGHVKVQKHGHKQEHGHGQIDYHDIPKYEFKYQVKDPHTHDIKEKYERRDGDAVMGYYKLHEPDGSVRDVQYQSEKHSGFHANVKFETHHVIPEKHQHH